MPRFLDRTNIRYGRLLAVEHKGKDNRGKHLWLCKCNCGNEKIVVSDNLSSGKSKSCGCLKAEFLAKKGNQFGLYKDRQKAMLKVQYSHLKRRHSNKNMIGAVIDFEVFKKLSNDSCKYCGLEHSKKIEDRLNESKNQKRLSDEVLLINGIDRIDSNIGYTKANCVTCCRFCNFAKHTMSENEFYKWIRRVYEFNFK
tara:strand:+ start:134 stop:724 length:591 start_codon:yes stop_codon:yes gene_type:complete